MSGTLLDRISYHAIYDESILSALEYAKMNGFKGIQVGIETPHLSFDHLGKYEIKKIVEFKNKYGLYLTLHAPDNITSLFSFPRSLKDGIFKYYRELFDFAKHIQAMLVTIHTGNMAVFPTDEETEIRVPEQDLKLYESAFRENMERILEILPPNVVLTVENYKMDRLNQRLLDPYLRSGKLSLCWDLAKSDDDLDRYFLNYLSYIKQVHIHDRREINGKIKSHRIVGTGQINFPEYFKILEKANVLDYCIEVRPREKALESLVAIKKMIPG